ncbi:MAG: hypothetical protein VX829_01105 [Pseudomonadota bacterium]|uniref:Uncharacterized protein n=1 Tax=Methylophaga aminisulfidivorans MP TaxID=1026882 RepID=F5SXG4_9GAMM|nr:hypothetical protein [Methylophaga aminisulfidivorans]EGL55097.1 hypothetical protein MAMP_02091 [Methylophaga aminisulfidivorans MP]MEC9411255.1 hypothetical protein [Pseudomonadota bacterium]
MTELKTFVYRDKRHIFLLLISCFAVWGVAARWLKCSAKSMS